MRLVYYFTSLGNGSSGTGGEYLGPTNNASANGLETEGFWYLWKTLIEREILDEVLIVIESARSPGIRKWGKNFELRVVPHIDDSEHLLRPSDIIFARGGFRSWFYFLDRMNKAKRWVLFYRAASNRLKWPFWDIVIEDLTGKNFNFGGRLHYKFNKPIHPDIFNFRGRVTRDIDVMFHASHIHDKKGQWKCVDAAIAYRKMYGKDFIAVMPGGFYGGAKTREAYGKLTSSNLPVYTPGMVPRKDLTNWMNRSKLYIHLGGAGQNDRGNLESMLCGCQQIIGTPSCHPPFVYEHPEISTVILNHSPDAVAACIHDMLWWWRPNFPERVTSYYQMQNGMEVAVGQMAALVNFIKKHPVPDRQAALKVFAS